MTSSRAERAALARKEIRAYFYQVRGLWPGIEVPSLIVHQVRVGDLAGWQKEEIGLLVEQAREQLGRQRDDVEAVRQRAQFLFSTCLGALVLFGLALSQLAVSIGGFIVGVIAGLLVVGSLLGTAGVVVARKELGIVDSALLSQVDPPVLETLARALARSVSTGENTLATLITVYRDAVFLLILGMVVFAGAFIVTL